MIQGYCSGLGVTRRIDVYRVFIGELSLQELHSIVIVK